MMTNRGFAVNRWNPARRVNVRDASAIVKLGQKLAFRTVLFCQNGGSTFPALVRVRSADCARQTSRFQGRPLDFMADLSISWQTSRFQGCHT